MRTWNTWYAIALGFATCVNRIRICFLSSFTIGNCLMFTGSMFQTECTPIRHLFYSVSIMVCFDRLLMKRNAEFTWVYVFLHNLKMFLEIDCILMYEIWHQSKQYNQFLCCNAVFFPVYYYVGLIKNKEDAMNWYKEAVKNGHQESEEDVERLSRMDASKGSSFLQYCCQCMQIITCFCYSFKYCYYHYPKHLIELYSVTECETVNCPVEE